MHEEIGCKVAVLHISPWPKEQHSMRDSQPFGQPRITLETWMTGNKKAKRLLARKTGDGPQERLQAFEPVIHGDEQCDSFFRMDPPSLSPFLAELRSIRIGKSLGIDGAMHNPKPIRTNVVVCLKMPGDHVTV